MAPWLKRADRLRLVAFESVGHKAFSGRMAHPRPQARRKIFLTNLSFARANTSSEVTMKTSASILLGIWNVIVLAVLVLLFGPGIELRPKGR
jgi:hypothetical protein